MTKTMEQTAHRGQIRDQANGYDILDCETCGFRHIWPMPGEQEINQIYSEAYYTQEKPDYIKIYEEDRDWWDLVYDDRFDLFEKRLPMDRRRLLDIGSGPGLFLQRAESRGWNAQGIEPSRQAAAYCIGNGLKVRNEFLTTRTTGLGRFDVVHLSAVLEHIPDPLEMLRIAHDQLDPGGLICVVVPNDYNPIQSAARDACGLPPWWLAPPHHINYFTPDSLAGCLERTGFEVLETSTTFPIDLFLLMGDNYTVDPQLGRACHKKRKALEFALNRAGLSELRQALYRNLIQLGIGREIVIFGRRPAAA